MNERFSLQIDYDCNSFRLSNYTNLISYHYKILPDLMKCFTININKILNTAEKWQI